MSYAKYKRNSELRAEIAFLADIPTDRYSASEQNRFTKAHLLDIARQLGDPPEDLTLAELYPWVCEAAGTDYNANAGNQWGLDRDRLKAIRLALLEVGP
jgi:hypothetical protein